MAWKQLCGVKDVECGSMKVVSADGVEFLVLRGEEGDVLVIPPSCPHMATSLCDGFFDGTLLTCSQHLWQWSVKDGAMMGIAEEPLSVYPSREHDGMISVDFNGELKYRHQADS